MLGKGSFGKVFLVENVNTGGLYAMKSLQDMVIDHEQIESTKLEKHILLTVRQINQWLT